LDRKKHREAIDLDDVAAKSGYSKWHLQRIFKCVTGQKLGSYIRARKLSQASIFLQLTSRPIIDIALQYHFDSQQSFTRAFRKQFSVTPDRHRRSKEWDMTRLYPPIHLDCLRLPEHKFIQIKPMKIVGITRRYTCNVEQTSSTHKKFREHLCLPFLSEICHMPTFLYVYGLHHTHPCHQRNDKQTVSYTTAIEYLEMEDTLTHGQVMELEGGDYVKFTFNAPQEDLQDFIFKLYGTYLPMLGLVRRRGCDIERFYIQKLSSDSLKFHTLGCDYFIPVNSTYNQSINLQ